MNTFILICLLAGALGGFLQGIIGVGTGIIVVPLLTFLLPYYGIPQNLDIHIALATGMATIVVTSIASLISYYQQDSIKWDIFNRIILFSMIGAALGAILTSYLPTTALKIIFSLFMFYVAWKMFFKKNTTESLDEFDRISTPRLAAGGTGTGVIASLIGAGGSILMVPFLHSQKLHMRFAVGTATMIGLPVSIVGTITFIFMGFKSTQHLSLMSGYLYWPAFLSISITGVIFAYLGAKLAGHMPKLLMQRVFSVCAFVVGIKMLL